MLNSSLNWFFKLVNQRSAHQRTAFSTSYFNMFSTLCLDEGVKSHALQSTSESLLNYILNCLIVHLRWDWRGSTSIFKFIKVHFVLDIPEVFTKDPFGWEQKKIIFRVVGCSCLYILSLPGVLDLFKVQWLTVLT